MAAACFSHLVLDSGPILTGSIQPLTKLLTKLSTKFYTVPEVMSELRDASTRERLVQFELIVRSPTAEACKMVIEFSKATGDYASLSTTDIKVLALVVTLELEVNGSDSKVKRAPDSPFVHVGRPKSQSVEADGIETDSIERPKSQQANNKQPATKVGCVTTDFAMQNVLLQMCLGLYTPDGIRIKQLKNWLLRCHGCYHTTKAMDRKFCPKCGNPTLIRTSYSVDSRGHVNLFLSKNFQYNNRGTRYSIPMPKGGRENGDLVLREDQVEYQRALRNWQRQEKKSLRCDDMSALDDRLACVFGDLKLKTSRAKTFLRGPPVIGYGRKNPNQVRNKK